MSARVQFLSKPGELARSLSPAARGAVQRKCSCGESGSAGGGCSECNAIKEKTLHHSGHEFGRVLVRGDGETQSAHVKAGHAMQEFPRINRQLPVLFDGITETETGHTDCDWSRDVKPDEPYIPRSGNPKLNITTNDPCIRDCTAEHENVHVGRLKPVCKSYYDCYTATEAEVAKQCKGTTGDELKKCRDMVVELKRLECFQDMAGKWDAQKWECEAYKKSLNCAEAAISKAKPECRPKLEQYRDSAKKQIEKYCQTAKEESSTKPDGGSAQPPPAQPKKQKEAPSGVR